MLHAFLKWINYVWWTQMRVVSSQCHSMYYTLYIIRVSLKWIIFIHTAWKVYKYGVFSGPYFPVFGHFSHSIIFTNHSGDLTELATFLYESFLYESNKKTPWKIFLNFYNHLHRCFFTILIKILMFSIALKQNFWYFLKN